MAFFRNNGGTYAVPKGIFRNNGGTYGAAKSLWRNVGGVWKQVWTSRSVSIRIASYTQVRSGIGLNTRYYDQVVLAVNVSDGAVPSSYAWSGNVYGTTAQATFRGPAYDPNEWTTSASANAYVTVVIGGEAYSAAFAFDYTTSSVN